MVMKKSEEKLADYVLIALILLYGLSPFVEAWLRQLKN